MSRTVAVVRWPVRASSRLSHRSSSSWRKGRRHQARTGGRNERPRVPSDATGPQFGQCPFNVTLTLRPATGWHQAWFLHRLTPRNTHYARVRKPSADPRVANGSAGLRQWVGDALQAAWTVFRGLEGYSHFVRPPNPPLWLRKTDRLCWLQRDTSQSSHSVSVPSGQTQDQTLTTRVSKASIIC